MKLTVCAVLLMVLPGCAMLDQYCPETRIVIEDDPATEKGAIVTGYCSESLLFRIKTDQITGLVSGDDQ